MNRGQVDQAGPLLRQAADLSKKLQGASHPHYARIVYNLGTYHFVRGEHAEAEKKLAEALAVTRGNLELASAVQSERQQLGMTLTVRHWMDFYLSLARRASDR